MSYRRYLIIGVVFSAIAAPASLLFYALIIRKYYLEAFSIPSSAMAPTIAIGDHILVNKSAYRSGGTFGAATISPNRGDIVVFTLPDDPATKEVDESDTNIIKRVVALPGETVELRGKELLINGAVQPEPYTQYVLGGTKSFAAHQVPAEEVFLLGDNRDQSKDSRYWDDPFVPINRMKGKAFFIYWTTEANSPRRFTYLD